jgi:hypothetical protein
MGAGGMIRLSSVPDVGKSHRARQLNVSPNNE